MTRTIVSQRPESCWKILNDKNSWALNELKVKKEFENLSDNCDEVYKARYIFKLLEILTENPINDRTYKSTSLKDKCSIV